MSTYKTPEEMDAAASEHEAEAKMLRLQAKQERKKQENVGTSIQPPSVEAQEARLKKPKPDWLDKHTKSYQQMIRIGS